ALAILRRRRSRSGGRSNIVRFANADDSCGSRSSSHITDSNPLMRSPPAGAPSSTGTRLTPCSPVRTRPDPPGHPRKGPAEHEPADDVARVVDPHVHAAPRDEPGERPPQGSPAEVLGQEGGGTGTCGGVAAREAGGAGAAEPVGVRRERRG